MRKSMMVASTIVLSALASIAGAQNLSVAPNAASLNRLAPQSAIAPTRVYVVQMAGEPSISYQGGEVGFEATAPRRGERYNSRLAKVRNYTEHLRDKQDRALSAVGASSRKVYSYSHAFNGFAARLTAVEAEKLRGNKDVMNVWEDRAVDLDTNNSPEFLGLLDRKDGLRTRLGLKGEDIVIGVLDSGAVQEHPSFADTITKPLPKFCDNPSWWQKPLCGFLEKFRTVRVYDAPRNWNGICQEGEAWAATDCNNKLIGARWFVDGFLAGRGSVVDGEFLSPRDSDGHGSHTASTAGGNEVTASLNGTPLAQISGMAPRARIAVYKTCWLSPGATNNSCFFSDSAAATDAAVADGVDVINFSVGTAFAFNDPQDLAFLRAVDAGVFVARSAGNEGPAPETVAAGEPWVTSVAASTQDGTAFAQAMSVNSPANVAGEYASLEGAITAPLALTGPKTDDLVAASPIDACTPLSNSIGGKIALIARGTCTFTVKIENAVNAGAAGVLMYTTPTASKTVMGGTATALTTSIPGVMIDNAPGVALLAELTAGNAVNVTLSASTYITEPLQGNIMADFSSRGPYPMETDWIKPDVTAPGVRILAAYAPEKADGSLGDLFQYLQGTSMSSPHVAGIGALLREAHPDWSPAAIKSALMTTARQNLVKEDGATPADPFDFGAGHIVPNDAVDPGLVYDAALFDYLAATCGTVSPLVTAGSCDFLAANGFSLDPANLNLPSIGVGELVGSKTIRRTVTNVSRNGRTKYRAEIEAPAGYEVSVSPSRLSLRRGETATYEVTITNVSAPPNEWRFGSLTWTARGGDDDDDRSSRGYAVRSPIAVNAVALSAPAEISGTGSNGSAQFDVGFGYTGPYTAQVHGLNSPLIVPGTVAQGGTAVIGINVPAGQALVRFALYDEYTSGQNDLDLDVLYCPGGTCISRIATSGGPTSREQVDAVFPQPGLYGIFIDGFATEGGNPADFALFVNGFGIVDDAGNMTASGPASAVVGGTGTVGVTWSGLATGAGAKYLGAVSHSDANGIIGLTIVSVDNDAGLGLGDLLP
ncbi:MAG: S8 family serine peptidase [Steroidobacteraceae bacterium]